MVKSLEPDSVAHACNPSYSGGREQEDHGPKAVQANSSQDSILKKPDTERAYGVVQVVKCLPSKCEA
jgi:hypothetical protein